MNRYLIPLAVPLLLGGAQEGTKSVWKTFSPPNGNFTIQFPGEPQEQNQTVKIAGGRDIQVTLYVLEARKGEGSLVVSYSQYPDELFKTGSDEKRLDNARDGAVQSARGKLKSEKKITLSSHLGRELWIESETKGSVRTRIYTVKNRLYQTMVVGTGKMVSSKDANMFLESFQLSK